MANRILVVDDETEIADLIEAYLTGENYTVSPAAFPISAAPNTAPPPATRPRSACTDPFSWASVRLMCTPASAATPRTALPSAGPCGTSGPAPHSSALFVCRFGYPSTVLLSFSDSLSGLFLALIGSLSFSLHLRHKTTFFPRRFFTFYHWR